jgi:hypothetical protein
MEIANYIGGAHDFVKNRVKLITEIEFEMDVVENHVARQTG